MAQRFLFALATTSTAGAVALAAGLTGGSSTVQASTLCYGAGVSGTITGTQSTPVECFTSGLGAICTAPATGLSPTIGVWAEACVPF